MNLPHRMAHRLPHDPKNLRHVQITMAHRPSRTGFWIGLLFSQGIWYILHQFVNSLTLPQMSGNAWHTYKLFSINPSSQM